MRVPDRPGFGRNRFGPRGLALLLVAAGCTSAPIRDSGLREPVEAISFADLPGWRADRHAEAVPALAGSCRRLATLPPGRELGRRGLAGPVRHMQEICTRLETASVTGPEAARRFFEAWFVPVSLSHPPSADGWFTGYFEPEVDGRRLPVAGGEPLYRRPPELVDLDLGAFRPELGGLRLAGQVRDGQLVPMPDRAAIQAGAFAGRNLELVWILDPVEAFFLHVQGSGRVRFADGSVLHVGYAGSNGHPYYAIGRTLQRRGAIASENLSMQSIAAWLRAHPEEMRALMAENPSYVFFEERPPSAPLGAAGVPLTPRRSIAVDPAYVPFHLPVWVATDVPVPGGGEVAVERLMMAQDTGSAIRGPARGDLFFGPGAEAREQAGRMRASGRLWILVPRRHAEGRAPADHH